MKIKMFLLAGWACVAGTASAALGDKDLDLLEKADLAKLYACKPAFTYATRLKACPFCGKWIGFEKKTVREMLQDPYRLKTTCCGTVIPEDESEWPKEGIWSRRRTVRIPHMDGSVRDYTFLVPEKDFTAGALARKVAIAPADWFCPSVEVWTKRANVLRDTVIGDLAKIVREDRNPKHRERAIRLLVAIYSRLAEILSAAVIADPCDDNANNVARNPGGKSYLTAETYRRTPVPCVYRKPAWFGQAYSRGPLGGAAGGWQDGIMGYCGQLLETWTLIRDLPEAAAVRAKVEKGVVEELRFVALWSPTSLRGGNTTYIWINGALRVSKALGEAYFKDQAIELVRIVAANHIYSDGMIAEGSLRPYSGLVANQFDCAKYLKENFDYDLLTELPLAARARQAVEGTMRGLHGATSSVGDDMACGFLSSSANWGTRPKAEADYSLFRGEWYPDCGYSFLRAGGEGSRLELVMDYTKTMGHSHQGQLGLQITYEGMPLLPELGYAICVVDPTRGIGLDHKDKYSFPMEPLPKESPSHKGLWGMWFGYGGMFETHNIATVDGGLGGAPYAGVPNTVRFATAGAVSDPAAFAQFMEAEAASVLSDGGLRKGCDVFDRQLVPVTLASGKSFAVDFQRVRGGHHHALQWHAPSDGPGRNPESSLGAATACAETNFLCYASGHGLTDASPGNRERYFERLTDLAVRRPAKGAAWKTTYRLRPDTYRPVTKEGQAFYESCRAALHDVDLDIWAAMDGSEATDEYALSMKGPYPVRIHEKAPKGYHRPMQTYLFAFSKALDFTFETREGGDGLYSVFSHVIAPRMAGGEATVRKMTRLPAAGLGAGVRVSTADGDVYVATTLADDGAFSADGFVLKGRLGVVAPDENAIRLFDGESVRLERDGKVWSAKVASTVKATLVRTIGDISGEPHRSALVVKSETPLPTDGSWNGMAINVIHPGMGQHTDGYEVASIVKLSDDTYRVDLARNPTFVVLDLRIEDFLKDQPARYKADYMFVKGPPIRGAYKGCRARFLRTGWETEFRANEQKGWFTSTFDVKGEPPKGQELKLGDRLLVYRIQPGDTVVFPSSLAAVVKNGRLEIQATGAYDVKMPGLE